MLDMPTGRLRRDLEWLAERLEDVPVPAGAWDAERRQIVAVVGDYLVPRLQHPDLPPVVGVVGLGGVGKSALVNALSGSPHSPEGPVRPVTTAPVVVAAGRRAGEAWSAFEDRFRGLRIVRDGGPTTEAVTLVDLPPFDESRWDAVVAACDLVLFVTTPTRYADAAGWAEIERLDGQRTPVWIVLKRAIGDEDEVVADLERRLQSTGVAAPVVAVTDTGPEGDPVAPVRERLQALAADRTFVQEAVLARSAALVDRVALLVQELDARRAAGEELSRHLDAAYDEASEDVRARVIAGDFGEGAAEIPWEEVAERLAVVITQHVGTAAERTARAWSVLAEGAPLLEGDGVGLWRHAADAAILARNRLDAWPSEIERIVASRSRRPLNASRRAEVADVVRRRVLGDRSKVRRRVRRRLGEGVDAAAGEALRRLADISAEIVAADRARFVDRIGVRPAPDLVRNLDELVVSLREPASTGSHNGEGSPEPGPSESPAGTASGEHVDVPEEAATEVDDA